MLPGLCCLALVTLFGACTGKRVTACQAQEKMTLSCSSDEQIVVRSVSYSYDPKPCDSPTDQNDCLTSSLILTTAAAQACNGKETCTIHYRSPMESAEVMSELRDPTQCQIGDRFYSSADLTLNHMAIVYDCRAYEFCTDLGDGDRTKKVLVRTAGFPLEKVRTNPSCSCEFATDDRTLRGLSLIGGCPNSNVTFRVRTRDVFGFNAGRVGPVMTVNCFNSSVVTLMDVVQLDQAVSVWADEDLSDERSSYKITVLAVRSDLSFSYDALVNVTCTDGGFFLTKTERLIIYVTVPIGVFLLIILIVICKVVKYRKRSAKRKKHAQTDHQELQNSDAQSRTAAANGLRRSADQLDSVETQQQLLPLLARHDATKSSEAVLADTAAAPQAQPRPTPAGRPSPMTKPASGKSVRHMTEQIRDAPDGEDLVQFASLLHRRRLLQEEEAASAHGSRPESRPGSRPTSVAYSMDFRPTSTSLSRRQPNGGAVGEPARLDAAAAVRAEDANQPLPPPLLASDVVTVPASAAPPSLPKVPSVKRMPAPPPPPPPAPANATGPRPVKTAASSAPAASGPVKPLPPPKPGGVSRGRSASPSSRLWSTNDSPVDHEAQLKSAPPKPSRVFSPTE